MVHHNNILYNLQFLVKINATINQKHVKSLGNYVKDIYTLYSEVLRHCWPLWYQIQPTLLLSQHTHGSPMHHINRIWNYMISKINWFTQNRCKIEKKSLKKIENDPLHHRYTLHDAMEWRDITLSAIKIVHDTAISTFSVNSTITRYITHNDWY